MKRKTARLIAILLVAVISAGALFGCSPKGKTVMEIDNTEISVNLLQLFLSRMKGTLASGYSYGEEALKDSFWDTVMSADGTTYNDYFTAVVVNNTKTYLAALSAFEALDLKLPQSYIDEIDKELAELVENDANGSKNEFNAILASYGVNYKLLREAYILEAKIAYLKESLYGANGEKISPVLVEEYYQENYARFKQVFFYTYELVYETDTNGDDIWYTEADKNRISYDTSATLKKDENGVILKDKNGDKIYVNEDGKVAYNKKNAQRKPRLDEDGNQMTREYTKEELIRVNDMATLVLDEAVEKDYTLFNKLVKTYSEDEGMTQYTNGYYVTKESNYDSPEVIEELFEMEEGEIRRISSDYGIHLVMRYPLDEGGYENKDNSDFFVSLNDSNLVFMADLKNQLLEEYLKPYVEKIEIDEKVIAGVDMKSVGANFYY